MQICKGYPAKQPATIPRRSHEKTCSTWCDLAIIHFPKGSLYLLLMPRRTLTLKRQTELRGDAPRISAAHAREHPYLHNVVSGGRIGRLIKSASTNRFVRMSESYFTHASTEPPRTCEINGNVTRSQDKAHWTVRALTYPRRRR